MRQMDTSPTDDLELSIENSNNTPSLAQNNSLTPSSQSNNSSQLLNHLLLTTPSVLDVALSITNSLVPSSDNPIMMDLDESMYELISNNISDDKQQQQSNSTLESCSCNCLKNNLPDDYELSSVCDSVWPSRLDSLCRLPMPSFETQLKCTWNPSDSSEHIYVQSGDPFTFHRHPTAQSTDCIRGGQGFSRGLHVWRIRWKSRQRGTHAVIGVCTGKAPLQAPGYKSLVGSNSESWGWDITRCRVMHDITVNGWRSYPILNEASKQNSSNQSNVAQNQNSSLNNQNSSQTLSAISNLSKKPDFIVPEYIMVILDMEEGTLSFSVNNQFLGIAFKGLYGKTLYPCVSAVWGHCEVSMNYLGGLSPAPLTLSQACRSMIRRKLLSTLRYHKNHLSSVQDQNLNCPITQTIENSLNGNETSNLKMINSQFPLINQVTISNALTNNNPIFIKNPQSSSTLSQASGAIGGVKGKPNTIDIKGKNSESAKNRQLSLLSHPLEQLTKGNNFSLVKLVNCLSLPYSLIDFILYRPQFINYAEVSQQNSPIQINLNNNNNNCTSSLLQAQYHPIQLPFQHIFNNVHQNSLINSQQQAYPSSNANQSSSSISSIVTNSIQISSPINWPSWTNSLSSPNNSTGMSEIRWSNLMVDPHSFVKRIINQSTNRSLNSATLNNSSSSPNQVSFYPSEDHPNNDPTDQSQTESNSELTSRDVWNNENEIS